MNTIEVPIELLQELSRTWSEHSSVAPENQEMNIAIIRFLNQTLWKHMAQELGVDNV